MSAAQALCCQDPSVLHHPRVFPSAKSLLLFFPFPSFPFLTFPFPPHIPNIDCIVIFYLFSNFPFPSSSFLFSFSTLPFSFISLFLLLSSLLLFFYFGFFFIFPFVFSSHFHLYFFFPPNSSLKPALFCLLARTFVTKGQRLPRQWGFFSRVFIVVVGIFPMLCSTLPTPVPTEGFGEGGARHKSPKEQHQLSCFSEPRPKELTH